MFFEGRPIRVTSIADAGELAEKLTSMTWELCRAFEIGGILLINDSTSGSGIQEYAVVYPDPERPGFGFQSDSITFGWMKVDGALTAILRVLHDGDPFKY